ncbi:hypothetical protein RRG08_016690 [Elysia crispata]|uniref:Uncharacterized protein n=1 Tax=Elysia crispata TaxID=231223 RepID=A0AAE1DZE7_9GAST|nr:hypothetical protein RRG08_016690 [Elysia crispata]
MFIVSELSFNASLTVNGKRPLNQLLRFHGVRDSLHLVHRAETRRQPLIGDKKVYMFIVITLVCLFMEWEVWRNKRVAKNATAKFSNSCESRGFSHFMKFQHSVQSCLFLHINAIKYIKTKVLLFAKQSSPQIVQDYIGVRLYSHHQAFRLSRSTITSGFSCTIKHSAVMTYIGFSRTFKTSDCLGSVLELSNAQVVKTYSGIWLSRNQQALRLCRHTLTSGFSPTIKPSGF